MISDGAKFEFKKFQYLKMNKSGFKVLSERNASELIVDPPVQEGQIGVEARNVHGRATSRTKVRGMAKNKVLYCILILYSKSQMNDDFQ